MNSIADRRLLNGSRGWAIVVVLALALAMLVGGQVRARAASATSLPAAAVLAVPAAAPAGAPAAAGAPSAGAPAAGAPAAGAPAAGAPAAGAPAAGAPAAGAVPVAGAPALAAVPAAAAQDAAPAPDSPIRLAAPGAAPTTGPPAESADPPVAATAQPAPAAVPAPEPAPVDRCSGDRWQQRRGEAALATLSSGAERTGFTVSFAPGRSGYLGLTHLEQHQIEVFVRACDVQSDELLRHVVAHELGHAYDTTRMTVETRAAFQAARGIPAGTDWYGCSGCTDFATPAGDFAEVYAQWARGATDNRSELAGVPGATELAELAVRFFGA